MDPQHGTSGQWQIAAHLRVLWNLERVQASLDLPTSIATKYCKNQYETYVGQSARSVKNEKKSIWGPFEQVSLQRSQAKAPLRLAGHDFGGVWVSFGRALGVFWPLLGAP